MNGEVGSVGGVLDSELGDGSAGVVLEMELGCCIGEWGVGNGMGVLDRRRVLKI